MGECSGIFQGAIFDCDNPLIAGVDENLILMNLSDIDSVTFDPTIPTIITDIILKNGTTAFEFQGTRNSLVPESHFVAGRFSVGYDHQLGFQIFDTTQRSKDNMERLAFRETVGVVEGSDGTFEVYGLTQGLEILNNDRLPADQDTGGSFSIIVKTSDNTVRETKLPQTWFDTDQAVTELAVQALLHQPIVDNITPIAGAAAGGTAFTVTGSNFFLNGVGNISSVDWVDSVGVLTNQAAFTVDNDTTISIASSVALVAGTFSLRVTANNGASGESAKVVIIS